MLFEFAQKHYFHEFDRRTAFNGGLPLLVALNSLYMGVFAFSLRYSGFNSKTETYVSQLIILSVIAFSYFAFNFFSFFGFSYDYVATPDKYISWHLVVLA